MIPWQVTQHPRPQINDANDGELVTSDGREQIAMVALEQLILESGVRSWLATPEDEMTGTSPHFGSVEIAAQMRRWAAQTDRVPLPSNEQVFSHYGTGVVRDLSLLLLPSTMILR